MVVAWGAGRPAALLLVVSSVLAWTLALAPPASAADLQVVSGSAFGEQVDALDGLITSGPVPSVTLPNSGGGRLTDSAGSVCVPAAVCGILRARDLRAAARGSLSGDGGVRGSASAANVNVAGVVTAELVQSSCAGAARGLSGVSVLANVSVGGQLLGSDPKPNTVIAVGSIARVTLNEQVRATHSITVNAIHVQLLSGNVGDVILPQAHCAVTPSLAPTIPESPLVVLLPALTIAASMGLIVIAWSRDPVVIGRSLR